MVEIEIDGQKVAVTEGSMVMEAANQLGIYVPHFCYHKKLSIAANCRMCLVEVEKMPKPLPACATPVSAGMIVRTQSPKTIQAQKAVMEFLLINHPLDCPICDQGGECQLQDLAFGYGGSGSRYQEEKRVVFHKNVGPLISMEEMNRCIHCTRCVRFGQEVAGVMELGMLGRGEHSEITTFVGKTVDSELSGNMIDLCPVGALLSKPFRYTARTWELIRRKSVSMHDGLGSNLNVQIKNNRVMRVLPLENEALNQCWLSDKDRFAYEGLNSSDRLTEPMIKRDGQWQTVDWQTALEFTVNRLQNVIKVQGANSVAALSTPYATLEELSLLSQLMAGIGSDHIDFRLRQTDFALNPASTGFKPWLGLSVAELEEQQQIFVVGSFLRADHPLLAARLRQAAKQGTKIHTLHAVNEDLLMPLATRLCVAPSKWVNSLVEILSALAELCSKTLPKGVSATTPNVEARTIAEKLLQGKSAILLGNSVLQHPQASTLHSLLQTIANWTDSRFGYLTDAANTVGAYVAGAYPKKAGHNALQMLTQQKAVYILHHVEPELDLNAPLARQAMKDAQLVIALSPYQHSLEYAHVLLPIAPFTETSGTFINCQGSVQSFQAVVAPLGQTRPAWKVLRVLGNLLNLKNFEYADSESVRDAVLQGSQNVSAQLSNQANGIEIQIPENLDAGLERLSDIPIYASDAIVRRAASLQQTRAAQVPQLRMAPATLQALGLQEGLSVKVTQAGHSATLTLKADAQMAEQTARISAAHSATAALGALFGQITVEPA